MNFLCDYRNFLSLLLLILMVKASEDNGTSSWMNVEVLDGAMSMHGSSKMPGRIVIKWNYTEDTITIFMAAKTKGWFGIGFLANRKNLSRADFVTGWVINDKAYLQDRHAEGSKLVLDKVQNYQLINGSENDTFSMISFQRKLNTCDNEDFKIEFGTTRIIWVIGKRDPQNETDDLDIEDADTGNKSVRIFTPKEPEVDVSKTEIYELRTKNVTISNEDGTKYWCTHSVYPITNGKHYMIGYDPVIQENNKPYVHHFIMYICPRSVLKNIYKEIDPQGYDCLDSKMVKYSSVCITYFAGWAVGYKGKRLNEDIGFPFGSDTEETYFKIEVHYNMPESVKSITDSSGIRLYHTNNFKPKHEAGVFPVGIGVTPFQVLPPGLPQIHTIGMCQPKCLKQKFPKDGITVFAVSFHTHLAGRKVIFRIFRNGEELKPIADNNFDFELQGTVILEKPINIKQDDILLTECVYDTSDRNSTTVGNFPTKSEMCLTFLNYYPVVDLAGCLSTLLPQDIYDLVGIKEINPLPPSLYNCTRSDCPVPISKPSVPQLLTVKKPDQCFNKTLTDCIKNYNQWTSEKIKTLNDLYYGTQQAICADNNGTFLSTEKDQVKYPTDAKSFKEISECQTK